MADTIWRVAFKGSEYTVTDQDLTVQRLRQMKQWYGREYGTYTQFITMLAQGDVDALACGIWIAKAAAGEKPRTPNEIDFNMSDIEFLAIEREPDEEENPTVAPATTTLDSAPTVSKTSGDDTSSTLPISAD
jgi:hypothetical protein